MNNRQKYEDKIIGTHNEIFIDKITKLIGLE